MDKPLAEEGLLIRRDDEAIDDDVVNKVRSHCAGIAEIIDLDRRRPVGEDHGPAECGVTGEIDQDVDAVPMDQLGGLAMRCFLDIDKAIEGVDETGAHRAPVVDDYRNSR